MLDWCLSCLSTIGYVTREEDPDSGGSRYSAFVAEIAPQGSVYSLNIECDRQILVRQLKFLRVGGSYPMIVFAIAYGNLLVIVNEMGI